MNKSGTTSQVISLPKGGGALHGIGEKFSPDLHTGTGNFTVPIALPPGRNGFQPQLNLVYSTGNGNGPFGLGWSSERPGRQPQDLQGRSRLRRRRKTPSSSPAPKTSCRWRHRDGDPLPSAHRRPVRPDRPPSRRRQTTTGRSAARTGWSASTARRDAAGGRSGRGRRSRADRTKVFAWKLTQNRRTPSATASSTSTSAIHGRRDRHHWDQLYLRQIRYADYADEDEDQVSGVGHVRAMRSAPTPSPSTAPASRSARGSGASASRSAPTPDEERLVRTYD